MSSWKTARSPLSAATRLTCWSSTWKPARATRCSRGADAVRLRAWDTLEKAFTEGTSVKGRIAERIKGGLRVDVDGISAFLPGSQIDVRPVRNLDSLRG